jgi:hypothetical protein
MSKEKPLYRPSVGAATRRPTADPLAPAAAPVSIPAQSSAREPGRVKFDDRGNAVYEWSVRTGEFARDSATSRLKKLDNPNLSLAEDAPTPVEVVRPNPHGVIKGYNPYDSGKLSGKQTPRKKDLKKLSEWLALRKQAAENKRDQD